MNDLELTESASAGNPDGDVDTETELSELTGGIFGEQVSVEIVSVGVSNFVRNSDKKADAVSFGTESAK